MSLVALLVLDVEIVLHVLADAQCALLTVNHFVIAIVLNAPVHNVQGESFQDGIYYGLLLLVVVAELALIYTLGTVLSTGTGDLETPSSLSFRLHLALLRLQLFVIRYPLGVCGR